VGCVLLSHRSVDRVVVHASLNPENANELVVAYASGEIMVWDVKARKLQRRLALSEKPVRRHPCFSFGDP